MALLIFHIPFAKDRAEFKLWSWVSLNLTFLNSMMSFLEWLVCLHLSNLKSPSNHSSYEANCMWTPCIPFTEASLPLWGLCNEGCAIHQCNLALTQPEKPSRPVHLRLLVLFPPAQLLFCQKASCLQPSLWPRSLPHGESSGKPSSYSPPPVFF